MSVSSNVQTPTQSYKEHENSRNMTWSKEQNKYLHIYSKKWRFMNYWQRIQNKYLKKIGDLQKNTARKLNKIRKWHLSKIRISMKKKIKKNKTAILVNISWNDNKKRAGWLYLH